MNEMINIVGWTIINSLWHGIFVLILLTIALIFINQRFARIRSMLAYASLILIFAASIRTFTEFNNARIAKKEVENYSSIEVTSNLLIFHNLNSPITNNYEADGSIWNKFIRSASFFSGNNINYIVGIWLLGIFILTLKLLGGYYYIQKLKKTDISPVEDKWHYLVGSIAEKINLSRSVKLLQSARINFPTVIGHFKPVILMPIGTLTGLPHSQIEMILAHELAHIKRADYLLNLIQSFLEIIYFFNPAVWIISKIIRDEREFACDDLALTINSNPSLLAHALISVNQNESRRPIVALSALGTKNSLLGRINRMVQSNNNQITYTKKIALSSALIAVLFAITIAACSSSMDNYNDSKTISASVLSLDNNLSNADNVINPENIEPMEPIENISAIDDSKTKRKFNFHKDDTHWRGTVEDGKVVKLYKDGERIPDNNINEYEAFILDTLDEIDSSLADLEIDMQEFKEEMKQLKEDLKDISIDINFDHMNEIGKHFNSEEFKKEMQDLKESLKDMEFEFNDEWKNELKESLKGLKEWDADFHHFKSEEFKHEMEDLKHELEHLKDIDFDVHVDFDKESFKESMKGLKENLKDLKVNMSDLDIDLSDLKVELEDLKVEMKHLKAFMNELRSDLVKEGYIENEDEDFDLDLNKDKITVNGKKLPDSLHQKYLDMYKDHFGKELKDSFRIRN